MAVNDRGLSLRETQQTIAPSDNPDVDLPAVAARRRALHIDDTSEPQDPRTTPEASPLAASAPHHGLVKRAHAIDPVVELPDGVKCVRRARPEDAEAIAAIQEHYALRKIDAADHPKNGWLVQKSSPDAIRFAMRHYKDFWVAEDHAGEVIAFQTVSAARFISRPAGKHKFVGPHGRRARQVLESGRFIYMSQIAIHPAFRGKRLAAALQAEVLRWYHKSYPLVAHVAVFTQDDLDAHDPSGPFDPRSNNVASHRLHQKGGYRFAGYTSDTRDPRYNTGLPPPDPAGDSLPGLVGAVYVHFRDGAEDLPFEYVDPVKAVLDAPVGAGDVDGGEWKNPFPDHWPEPDAFDEADPSWSEARAKRYTEAKERLELLFLQAPLSGLQSL